MAAPIRLATAADGAALAAIYAPAVTDAATSFETEPPDAAEMAGRVTRLLPRLPWIVCDDGEVRGYAYATPHRDRTAYQWSVEVSVYVAPATHRSGVGRALYTSLFALLAELGLVNLYAGITLPNPASVGFHTSMGFREVGVYRAIGYKFGTWHDVVWLERLVASRPANPSPPVALAALPDRTIAAALATGARLLRR